MKKEKLNKVPRAARSFVEGYFRSLSEVKPIAMIDAIERNETLKIQYENAPKLSDFRMSVMLARNFLRTFPHYWKSLEPAIDKDLILLMYQFENPASYKIVQRYGKKGIEFVAQCCKDVKTLIMPSPKSKK